MNSAAKVSFAAALSAAAWLVIANLAIAEHADILVARSPSGQLVTGTADFDAGEWLVGARTFEGELPAVPLLDDPSGIYFEADPGFNGRSQADLDADNPPPATFLTLPGLADVSFDIVPLSIGGNDANLFYWDGVGAVNFQPAAGATLTFSVGSSSAAANGANTIIQGFNIETTDADGVIHRHPDYVLDDGVAGSYAPEGVYLLPLVARMDGLTTSDVFAITFAAGEVDEEMHEAAVAWVEAHVAPEPATFALALVAGSLLVVLCLRRFGG